MRSAVLAATDILAWPALQLGAAFVASRLGARRFAHDNVFYRIRSWELLLYRRLRIRRWKRLLPDGGAWAGNSFRKKTLAARSSAYFTQFILETRRGEATHLFVLACTPLFFLWNPPWACVAIALYAFLANAPCILAQRYNRARMQRLITRENSL